MKVLFRVDSSFKIGSGHISRSVIVARELKRKGFDIAFACARLPGNLISEVKTEFKVVELSVQDDVSKSEDWHTTFNWGDDSREVVEQVSQWRPDVFWVDHYGVGHRWQKRLQENFPSSSQVVVDDLANRELIGSFVINPNLIAIAPGVYEKLVPKYTGVCFGPTFGAYTIAPNFIKARENANERTSLKSILVFFGSAESGGAALSFASALLKSEIKDEFLFTIIAGKLNQDFEQIAETCKGTKIKVVKELPDFSVTLQTFDLAIGSGGVNSWERSFVGLPSALIEIADNQSSGIESLVDSGAAKSFGKLANVNWSEVFNFVRQLEKTPNLLQEMSKSAFSICGNSRDLPFVLNQLGANVILRRADSRDSKLLFDLRNDPITREQSLQSYEVKWEDHESWFTSSLVNSNRQIYIATAGEKIVGMARADRHCHTPQIELSWAVLPNERGKGYGKSIVQSAAALYLNQKVTARIKTSNLGSIAIAEAVGYQLVSEVDGVGQWEIG